MGFKTITTGRGKDEEELVKNLGAMKYIDSRSQNVEELNKLGGAKMILGTMPSGKAMSGVLGGEWETCCYWCVRWVNRSTSNFIYLRASIFGMA